MDDEKQRKIDDRISRWSIILFLIYAAIVFPLFCYWAYLLS